MRKKDHEARIRELERTVVRLELMLNNRSVPPHLRHNDKVSGGGTPSA